MENICCVISVYSANVNKQFSTSMDFAMVNVPSLKYYNI